MPRPASERSSDEARNARPHGLRRDQSSNAVLGFVCVEIASLRWLLIGQDCPIAGRLPAPQSSRPRSGKSSFGETGGMLHKLPESRVPSLARRSYYAAGFRTTVAGGVDGGVFWKRQ